MKALLLSRMKVATGLILLTALAFVGIGFAINKKNHSPKANASQDNVVENHTVNPTQVGTESSKSPSEKPSNGVAISKSAPQSRLNNPQITTSVVPAPEELDEMNPLNTSRPGKSVIYGHVYYDASGNACGKGPTGYCKMPVQKSIEIRDELGNLVQTVRSDTQGAFTAVVKPGTYTLVPEPGSGVNPTAQIQSVKATSNNSCDVEIMYYAIAMTNTVVF